MKTTNKPIQVPHLNTQRLTIRAFQSDDLADFAAYRADPIIAQYQSWNDYTEEDALRFYSNMDYQMFGVAGLWFQLALIEKDSQQLIGDIALHFVDEQQVEVGFTLARTAQKKGYATEAMKSVIDYLFSVLKKHRITATTDAENSASMTLLMRLGFRKEGHFIQNIFFKGKWGDECAFALLNKEHLSYEFA